MTKKSIRKRLEEIREEIVNERVSWGELAELQSLRKHIDKNDLLLNQWVGVPVYPEAADAIVRDKRIEQLKWFDKDTIKQASLPYNQSLVAKELSEIERRTKLCGFDWEKCGHTIIREECIIYLIGPAKTAILLLSEGEKSQEEGVFLLSREARFHLCVFAVAGWKIPTDNPITIAKGFKDLSREEKITVAKGVIKEFKEQMGVNVPEFYPEAMDLP